MPSLDPAVAEAREAARLADRVLLNDLERTVLDALRMRGRYGDPDRNWTCAFLVAVGEVVEFLRVRGREERDRAWFEELHWLLVESQAFPELGRTETVR
jgi:hypothetical protein